MSGPDFIVIGAMKCGTTTLAAQLAAQDGLFMTRPKEPNYFSDDAVFARGARWYERLFDGAQPGELRGEASTHYTKRPAYPETVSRMKAAYPNLRLVYMIRNPMNRIVSHYIHDWSEAVVNGPLNAALLEQHPELVDYGRYGWQVLPFIEAFGREAVLLTSLERLSAERERELARIAAHLGHRGKVEWDADHDAENVSSDRVRKLPLHEIIIEHPLAARLRRAVVPKSLRNGVREARRLKERPVIPPDAKPGLEAMFLEDREVLARFFPGDASLDLAYPFAGRAR